MGAAGGGAVSSLDEVCVVVKDELTCGGFSQERHPLPTWSLNAKDPMLGR